MEAASRQAVSKFSYVLFDVVFSSNPHKVANLFSRVVTNDDLMYLLLVKIYQSYALVVVDIFLFARKDSVT